MSKIETKAQDRAGAQDGLSPEAEVTAALAGFMSDIKVFHDDIQSKMQQQEERLTMLDRKNLTVSRPALAAETDLDAPHRKAFEAYVRSGDDDGLRGLQLEGKALNTAVAGDGGYLVDPQTAATIQSVLRSNASVRAIASVVNVDGTSYDVLIDHGDVGTGWASETGSITETSTPTIERISIPLHELSALPKASQRLLDDSAFDIETWLAARIADKFARAEAAAFISGDGSDKPTGFLTHSLVQNDSWAWGNLGYIATGTSGDFDPVNPADAIFDLVYGLDAEYRAGATFVMNSKTAGAVRKMKDADGRFLWSDGLAAETPARLVGYLRALTEFWSDPENNPVDAESGVQMLDMARAHVWAWDARPFPWFPGLSTLWSDAANYRCGHWLNGRASNRGLASVVEEICARSGVTAVETAGLYGLVRGYGVGQVAGGRNALQPLMLAYGAEAAEREGEMRFFTRTGLATQRLTEDGLVLSDALEGSVELNRAPEAELAGRVRLSFIEADGGYETRTAETVFPDEPTRAVSQSELSLVLTGGEARAITERWLSEARVARDSARFALPPSALGVMAGDVVALDPGDGAGLFRIDRVEQAGLSLIDATRVEPLIYAPAETLELGVALPAITPAVPVLPLFMDLPLLSGHEQPHAPHLAVTARPWPGRVALYRAPEDDGYELIGLVKTPARLGVTESVLPAARAGLLDRGPALRVRMSSGELASAALDRVLNGANLAAIGDGSPENWEIFQFTSAELVGDGLYEISGRLRGQAGSDAIMPESWPVGSYVVMLDGAVGQIPLEASERGLARDYRIGPASRALSDATYRHEVLAFSGVGLRPLAPVHLTACWQGGDLGLSWIRRSRIDSDSWQAEEVPLGEEAELYRLRVMGGATVLREVDVTSPGWTYSAALQAEDGVGASFAVELAQVSQSFGPGPFRRISVSR